MPDTPASLVEVEMAFAAGEHHAAHETRIPEGFARRVVNFDLDDSGLAVTRPELAAVTSGDSHSVWEAPTLGMTLLVEKGRIAQFRRGVVEALLDAAGSVRRVRTEAPMYWVENNEVVYFTNGVVNGVVTPDGRVHDWWVHNPVSGNRISNGEQVRYLTYEDAQGRESGAVRFDTGTAPYVPGRVSRLYWADEDSTQYRLDGSGRTLATQGRVVMPPGRYLTFYAGRAFVARGPLLYYSDPLNPGLCDLRYNFEEFPAPITMLAAVTSGMYVGTAGSVYFLSGADPASWTRQQAAHTGALAGSAVQVPADVLSSELLADNPTAQFVVAYLTRSGVALGLDGGVVLEPTREHLRLPADAAVRLTVVPRDGYHQLVATPQHPVRPAIARAIDSPVTSKEEL